MAKKTEAYVDTSAFVAFLDGSDSYHALFTRLFAAAPPLVTTPLVVAEGHGWFLKRFDRHRARQFLNFVEEVEPLRIVPVGAKELAAARRYLSRFKDQDLSVVDALGLHCMDALRIAECWSTDRHLGLTGKTICVFGEH